MGGATKLKIQRVNILGVGVSAIHMEQALTSIDQWIATQERRFVCVTGVHGIMESQREESLRLIHNQAGLVTPDGMPLVWLSRWNGTPNTDRVYGPDLMKAVCQESLLKGYRHFLYGGAEGVPEKLEERLQQQFPGLNVVGTYSPPFRSLTPEEDAHIVQMINDQQPDIVWVGLSTPKQERWMAGHRSQIQAPVLIGVGAAFDFHAELKPQAPGWMQRNALEWLFRLVTEPKRLWRRYLINNPAFLLAIVLQFIGLKKYGLD